MVEIEFNAIWQQYEADKERRRQLAAGADAPAEEGAGEAAGAGVPAAEGPVDAAAIVAPEESALEGATERAPASAEAEKPHEPEPAPRRARSRRASAKEPIDAAAVVAPEETALEGASDSDNGPASPADEDEEKARAEFRRIAERRVRLGLLLAEVGRNNNINVGQEELNQALAMEARRMPGYERQVIEYYRQHPDALNHLRAPIFEDKVVDFIVELAKPEEKKVTPQELMASAESQGEGESECESAA